MRALPLILAVLCACAPSAETASPSAVAPTTTPSPEARTETRETFRVEITGRGPDVVLIPGLTCGGHVWDPTVTHLAADHTVHVLTLAGFAGTPRAPGESFLPRVREELTEYLRSLERPVLIGHSLGGFMAFWISSSEPGLLAGAIAVDGLPALGALSGQDEAAVATFAVQMEQQMASLSQDAFAQQTAQTLLAQISDPDEAARVAQVSGRSDPAIVGRAMAELLTHDLRSEVNRAVPCTSRDDPPP
jgi:pimeloyl-ACP methyl ester carboxylesterase